jgi:hypothetical protein
MPLASLAATADHGWRKLDNREKALALGKCTCARHCICMTFDVTVFFVVRVGFEPAGIYAVAVFADRASHVHRVSART